MGLFDLFKDNDEYEGSHTGRKKEDEASSFDAEQMKDTSDVLDWLKDNKAIVLSEDNGLVVYTDEDGVNFIQVFTDASEVIDEKLTEFATVNYDDFVSLFEELGDVDYLVVNPSTQPFVIKKEEFSEEKEPINLESEVARENLFPSRGQRHHESNSSFESLSESLNSSFESEFSEASTSESESEHAVVESEFPEMVAQPHQSDNHNLKAVKVLPSSFINELAAFIKKNSEVKKLYLAENIESSKLSYSLYFEGGADASAFNQETETLSVIVALTNGSLAGRLQSDDFLLYQAGAGNGSEDERLDYIQNHPIFYPNSDGETNELISFTDFTQIPSQFLLAFESFVVASYFDLVDYLEPRKEIESVYVDPFTNGPRIQSEILLAMDKRKTNVLVAGLGMIGSSISLGIRRAKENVRIFGYDTEEVLDIAERKGFLYRKVTDLEKSARFADFIILATPVEETISLLQELSGYQLKPTVIVTDTGSTKAEVVNAAEVAFSGKNVNFVGGHPMAGSHKSGPIAADVNLFENAYYVLTEENEQLTDLLSGLHAKFIIVDAAEHDRVTSQVSHFPHVLASSLILQTDAYAEEHPLANNLAAGGFRDMTRIADSDATMWTSVLLSNSDEILGRIEDFKHQLDHASDIIRTGSEEEIKGYLEESKQAREKMEIHKGALQPFNDLFISVPDERGAVLNVLKALEDFSITNIKINEENREDITGVLQISFKSAEDLERAKYYIQKQTTYNIVD